MDNQHRQIKGYRELSQAEIDLMNRVKASGAILGALVDELKAHPDTDKRWAAIGATDLQTGLMALTRAIAKPTFFALALLLLAGCTSFFSTETCTPQKDGYYHCAGVAQWEREPACNGSCKP